MKKVISSIEYRSFLKCVKARSKKICFLLISFASIVDAKCISSVNAIYPVTVWCSVKTCKHKKQFYTKIEKYEKLQYGILFVKIIYLVSFKKDWTTFLYQMFYRNVWKKTDISASFSTDHLPVIFSLNQMSEFSPRKSKFLLLNKVYVEKTKEKTYFVNEWWSQRETS